MPCAGHASIKLRQTMIIYVELKGHIKFVRYARISTVRADSVEILFDRAYLRYWEPVFLRHLGKMQPKIRGR